MCKNVIREEDCIAKCRCLVQFLSIQVFGDALILPEISNPAQAVAACEQEMIMVYWLLLMPLKEHRLLSFGHS